MKFSEKIIDWYLQNKRELPWRNTQNPYYIWLSEIILQQTRVVQGMDYYYAFIEKYPTIIDLANASEEEVLKTWQGLGYYTRARNLHATANYIKDNYKGIFPQKYEEILKLKGIGKYTAAAIASFAFKQSYPVVDGNVYRFISRLKGIFTPINTEKAYTEFHSLLEKEIDSKQPDLFNHAIMELGAMVCKPLNPLCQECPFSSECYALRNEKIKELPLKNKLKAQEHRYFYFIVLKIENKNEYYTLLRKRVHKDIWQNLYEFPYFETKNELDSINLTNELNVVLNKWDIDNYNIVRISGETKHQLSHQTIHAFFMEISTNQPPQIPENYIVIHSTEIQNFPISALIDKYLKNV